MRPSSSTSELFGGVFARGPVSLDDEAWVAALLRVESALARVQAGLGVVPSDAATAIAGACASLRPDPAELAAATAEGGNPVIPLVAAVRSAVPPQVASYVHKGATSQDIMDSAVMLLAHDALGLIISEARAAAEAAAGLARRYRDTPMAGRTLLRQALPVTFGLKAAGWLVALDEVGDRLNAVRAGRLAVQFGGPAGTLTGLDGQGLAIVAGLAGALGLAEPVLPWHTDRTRIAELAGALGELAGVCAKVGRDITLLAQTEVAEVAEGAPGGSSSMAHKRNPIGAVSAIACATRAPALVATLHATMVQEHERAAGAWHAEWLPLRDLLVTTSSAVAWLRHALAGLIVDPDRMESNMDDLVATLGGADLGESAALVDRVLAGRERRSR